MIDLSKCAPSVCIRLEVRQASFKMIKGFIKSAKFCRSDTLLIMQNGQAPELCWRTNSYCRIENNRGFLKLAGICQLPGLVGQLSDSETINRIVTDRI